jgi:hypothetical protein
LAHRGLWRTREEQNAPAALKLSLEEGYGLETDIRDRDGVLVVSHDCPDATAPRLSDVWRDWTALAHADRPLALNVKADGMAAAFVDLVRDLPPEAAFFFDMSVPDMRPYLTLGLPVFTRHSDVEPVPAYYDKCRGVWLDALDGPWDMKEAIAGHLGRKGCGRGVGGAARAGHDRAVGNASGVPRRAARVALHRPAARLRGVWTMKGVDAILFDLDGVLVDARPMIRHVIDNVAVPGARTVLVAGAAHASATRLRSRTSSPSRRGSGG